MSVHQRRSLEPFSKKFHDCLEAYDDAGGDSDEKRQFKEQVLHALTAKSYRGPIPDCDAPTSDQAWGPVLRELDALDAALRQIKTLSSSSGERGRGGAAYRPEEILGLWEPVLMHAIVALRGKLGHTTISTAGSVYDRYDYNPFKRRLNDALDTYNFYMNDTYFEKECQVLEKRFLERLDAALTLGSTEISGPLVDLNVKGQGKAWKAILDQLDALDGALRRAATHPSEADRRLMEPKRLDRALFAKLPELERLIREYRASELGTPHGAGHSERSLASQTSRALQRQQVYVPLARSSV